MAERLLAWAFGALHALVLLVAFVALVYRTGGAGEVLGDIGTLPGLAIGLWLCALSWGATAWALRGESVEGEVGTVVAKAGFAGAAAGALFVAVVFLAFALRGGGFVPAAGVALLLASGFAGVAGAIVGVVLALVDVALWRLARALVTASSA